MNGEKFTNFLINETDQKKIKGGYNPSFTDDQIQTIFDFSSVGGINSTSGKAFADIIRHLSITDLGYDVLANLYAANKQNNFHITVTDNQPRPGDLAYYDPATGNLDFSGTKSDVISSDLVDQGVGFQIVVHEIWHAFENLASLSYSSSNISHSVQKEIDANLFASLCARQYDSYATYSTGQGTTDWEHSGTSYAGTHNYYDGKVDMTNITSFNIAYWNIMMQQQFTDANYAVLVSQFKNSDFNSGQGYNSYDLNSLPVLQSDLYKFFVIDVLESHGKFISPDTGTGDYEGTGSPSYFTGGYFQDGQGNGYLEFFSNPFFNGTYTSTPGSNDNSTSQPGQMFYYSIYTGLPCKAGDPGAYSRLNTDPPKMIINH